MLDQNPNSASAWRARIQACKTEKRDLVPGWSESIEYRRGHPFASESDHDRINVNIDWALTKAKHAQLFSQTPTVTATTDNPQLQPLASKFAKLLNNYLTKANTGAAVDEAVLDCINASGIGSVLVAYEARTEEIEIPAVDPLTAQMLQASGQPVPTTKQKRVTSARFSVERLSPADLLWDVNFGRSDWDQASWIGRSGRKFWDDAQRDFGLKDEDREKICGDSERRDTLRDGNGSDSTRHSEPSTVEFDEIFYRATSFDPEAKYFDGIQRLVFVHGVDNPVIDEPWNGQRFDEQTGQYLGSCKFPIRVLTLSYISDDAIPPSDTAIGRPQVNELIRSRTNRMMNRERSIPIRWADPNRVDPLVMSKLMAGNWQDILPIVNGTSAIGEIARASYPREDHELDQIAKHDLNEQWSLGANQMGQYASGERSATEAANIARANDARIGYERARVAKFFVGISEVVAGLLVLYAPDVPDEARQALGQEFALTVRPDSTVLMDAGTRFQQLAQFLNLTAKSGAYDVLPVVQEMAALANVSVEIKPPNPPKPEEPNISLRFSGEDLLNPAVIQLLQIRGVIPPSQPTPVQPELAPGLERIVKRVDEQ